MENVPEGILAAVFVGGITAGILFIITWCWDRR